MIVHIKKKIFLEGQEWVDIRSDIISRHRAKKSDMRIVVGNETILIPYGKLRYGRKINKEVFDMQYPPFEKYHLISFPWRDPQKLTELQVKLLSPQLY